MSFADKIKDELCHLAIDNDMETRAEFLGYVKSRGSLRISNAKKYLVISLNSITSLKRLYTLSKKLGITSVETSITEETRLKHRRGGEILYSFNKIYGFLEKFGISILSDDLPDFVKKDPAYFGAFMRGLYLAGGSVVDPSRGYHLEISLDTTKNFILNLTNHLANFLNIKAGYIEVGNKYKVYIKSSRDIVELLSLVEASRAVSVLLKAVEVRQIRGNVSRTLNFITANANKSGQAMARHVRAIRIIERKLGLDSLPADLEKLAKLRLEYEELNLRELGELMDPPMSKSAVFNRLKKLQKIAEKLEGEK
ncbi:MAG: DNA-binding protein WhiA [Thermotogae bacterium]|uniref:DNA-binding protein WhiA n=1 Tax=Kosmotoga sp. TaxID=1955248 RepID=UPI000F192AB6|nr:DNA-binding protein WhiA [Kosmotoga sp.]MCD6160120.1 DNA-binding protein WhiA [Kosmotoga sp.]RKX49243.1 MAG: DNA-binding protein WhiA [Thermotogota bacterium]